MLVHPFSFEASRGDRLAIKGASGAGKTTILRLLLGFEKPQSGSIAVDGTLLSAKNIRQWRQKTAWLPQDLNIGSGSLKEVMEFPFQFKTNAANRPDEQEMLHALSALNLEEKHWDEKFENLSTGQRQRAGLALCHLMRKPVLLLDEPTSALDQPSKERVAHLLFGVKDRIIISTSHDPWWLRQCDKTLTLNTG